jgi:flagellar basal body-associated protein FliL
MRLLTLVVLVLAALHGIAAFTTKKRDPSHKRPAFSAVSSSNAGKEQATQQQQQPEEMTATSNPQPAFVAVQVVNLEDDDVVIGYGTGLVACIVSLALGYTLGYGGNL